MARPALVVDNINIEQPEHTLKPGGGGGTFDGMEARVKALEDKFDRIDGKLNVIGSDLAFLKGKAEDAPTGRDFGELTGRVNSLPTTAKIAGLLAIAVAILTIVTKWSALMGAFPPSP